MTSTRNFYEGAAQRINKQNGVGNHLFHRRSMNSIFCFWATHINRKWNVCTLERWFWTNFEENSFFKSKALSNINLVVPRHIKQKKAYFWLTSVVQKRHCLNSLLTSNVRTVNGTPIMVITSSLFLIGMKDTGVWFLNKNLGKYNDAQSLKVWKPGVKSVQSHILS